MGVAMMVNKRMLFVTSWTVLNDSKHIQARLSLISTDWLHLRAARVPRCQDLAIFVMTTTTDRQTNYLTPGHGHGIVICVACIVYVALCQGHSPFKIRIWHTLIASMSDCSQSLSKHIGTRRYLSGLHYTCVLNEKPHPQ